MIDALILYAYYGAVAITVVALLSIFVMCGVGLCKMLYDTFVSKS